MTKLLLTLFLPIVLGYLLVKTKYLKAELNKSIKILVIKVTVPCSIFISMYNTNLDTIRQILPLALSYVLLTILLIFSTYLLFFKIKDARLKAAYMIAISFGNYGYMGWAVLDGVFGSEGFARGVFFTTLWWPGIYLGTLLIAKLTGLDKKLDIKSYIVNMSVPISALILGITFNLLKIPIFEPIESLISAFGNMTVKLILFSVGLTISFGDSFKYMKKILIPLILRPILGLILGIITITIIGITDPISRNSVILESTMPVAVLSLILGDMLDLDEKLLSSILIVSTLFSLITIPLTLILIK